MPTDALPRTTPANDDQEILTPDEMAVRLRWNRKTLYNRIKDGEVPGVLPGRPIRILWSAYLAAVSTGDGSTRKAVRRYRRK